MLELKLIHVGKWGPYRQSASEDFVFVQDCHFES